MRVAEKVWIWMLRLCGLLLTVIGAIGVVTPILPGTVFLILATICFSKSDPKLEKWLLNHPKFGQVLRNWFESGTISAKTKKFAIALIVISFSYTQYQLATYNGKDHTLRTYQIPFLLAILVCEISLVAYLATRPTSGTPNPVKTL